MKQIVLPAHNFRNSIMNIINYSMMDDIEIVLAGSVISVIVSISVILISRRCEGRTRSVLFSEERNNKLLRPDCLVGWYYHPMENTSYLFIPYPTPLPVTYIPCLVEMGTYDSFIENPRFTAVANVFVTMPYDSCYGHVIKTVPPVRHRSIYTYLASSPRIR